MSRLKFRGLFPSWCFLPGFQSEGWAPPRCGRGQRRPWCGTSCPQAGGSAGCREESAGRAPRGPRTSDQAKLRPSPLEGPVGRGRVTKAPGTETRRPRPPLRSPAGIRGRSARTSRARPTFGSKGPRHARPSGSAERATAAEEAQVQSSRPDRSARARPRAGDQGRGALGGRGPEPGLSARPAAVRTPAVRWDGPRSPTSLSSSGSQLAPRPGPAASPLQESADARGSGRAPWGRSRAGWIAPSPATRAPTRPSGTHFICRRAGDRACPSGLWPGLGDEREARRLAFPITGTWEEQAVHSLGAFSPCLEGQLLEGCTGDKLHFPRGQSFTDLPWSFKLHTAKAFLLKAVHSL